MPHLNEREMGKRMGADSLIEQRRVRGGGSVEKGLKVGGNYGGCQGPVKELRRRVEETMGRW